MAQTIGFFDGVHRGHKHLLRQVADEADRRGLKSMVVTFKQHPRKVLQHDVSVPLLTTTDEKLKLIEQCGVDNVALLDFTPQLAQMDARQYMETVLRDQLHGRALVIGYDHHFGRRDGSGFAQYRQYGKELGIDVVLATQLPLEGSLHASSTVVRNALINGDVKLANEILGRPYTLTGTVAHGEAIGRTIGFPTANIKPECADKLIPHNGVYAVKTLVGNTTVNGMLYIGERPTFNNLTERRIEANLFDFNGEIYGQTITIAFVAKVRDEQRFDSLEQLKEQLKIDRAQVENILNTSL